MILSLETLEASPRLQATSNTSLPDDLLLSIVARVSRLYYPTLYLVSKSFRTLLASPELYKARSLLGHSESCLYMCLRFYYHTNYWFTLCRKPDLTLTNDNNIIKGEKNKSSGYVLARVPNLLHSPPLISSSLVSVGSNIYNIAGSSYLKSSSSVSILDCRSHTWHEAPSLREKLCSVSASVLDRKIYVAGSFMDGDSRYSLKNSFEVFDTETQTWDPQPITCSETNRDYFYECKSACVDGKFHVVVSRGEAVSYNSKEGRWDMVGLEMDQYMVSAYCEIENNLYSCTHGVFRWYDTKARMWRLLNGLVELPNILSDANVKLADYGGKMAVLWEEDLPYGGLDSCKKKIIRCAKIALEKRKSCEIWGIVEWFGDVLTVPGKYNVLYKVLAVTL